MLERCSLAIRIWSRIIRRRGVLLSRWSGNLICKESRLLTTSRNFLHGRLTTLLPSICHASALVSLKILAAFSSSILKVQQFLLFWNMKRGRKESSGLHPHRSHRQLTGDALAYLKRVKEIFKDNKQKYDDFLEILKAFKARRLDRVGAIVRVRVLCEGHHSLILGFNTFLPKGYEITIPSGQQRFTLNQAINYVNKIKTRFQNDEHAYNNFWDKIKMYTNGIKSMDEVYTEVETLFYDHQDLLEEFTYFLKQDEN